MREQDFKRLVASVRQAGRLKRRKMRPSRVFVFRLEDIRAIRAKLHKLQSEFAQMIGVSVETLQNWEQGRRVPDGPARALLKMAAEKPRAVAEALGAKLAG